MTKLRQGISTFAASGCASSYSEFLEGEGIYKQIGYLNDHISWPRLSYLSRYQAVLTLESAQCANVF